MSLFEKPKKSVKDSIEGETPVSGRGELSNNTLEKTPLYALKADGSTPPIESETKQAPVPQEEDFARNEYNKGVMGVNPVGGIPSYIREAWQDLDASIASVFAKWSSKLTSYRILKEWLENG